MTELADRIDSGPDGSREGVDRRLADSRDESFVRSLFADTRDDLLLLPPDTRDVIIDMQYRAQRRAWRRDHPAAREEIVLYRGVRAGHLLLADDGATITVVDLAVRSGLRGLGIGTDLLTELVCGADERRVAMQARTWHANHGARRIFGRFGFRPGGAVAGFHELFRPPVER